MELIISLFYRENMMNYGIKNRVTGLIGKVEAHSTRRLAALDSQGAPLARMTPIPFSMAIRVP